MTEKNKRNNTQKPKRPHVPKVTHGPKQKSNSVAGIETKTETHKEISAKEVFKHKSS